MTLYEKLKQDLTKAIKAKDESKKDALRVIIGELGRLPAKEPTDEDILKIMQKLLKSEKELLDKKGDTLASDFQLIIENYLPQKASEEEIAAWISQNIDLTGFKNKMQAMGPIMKHFGATADGNMVKDILKKM